MTLKEQEEQEEERIKTVRCPICSVKLKLAYNKKYRRQYYFCPMGCNISLSAHPDGTPAGIPVIKEVRELRKYAHILADRIWEYEDLPKREKMYIWLGKNSISGHFGMMNEDELIDIIDKLQKIIKRFKK